MPVTKMPPRLAAGFSMLEMLVAILIIAIGLLGFASILIKATQGNRSAFFHTQASVLSSSIIEAMRANSQDARSGLYVINLVSTPLSSGTPSAQDLVTWKNDIGQQLPLGQGSITLNSDGSTTITIQWSIGNNQTASFVTQTVI